MVSAFQDNAKVYESFEYYFDSQNSTQTHTGQATARVGQAVIPGQFG